ncbi:MAG: hypothetical protein AAFY46_03310, partial [Planctomycetota bacterium]
MRSPQTSLGIVVAVATCGTVVADILNVPGDFPTLSSAIDAATDGDEIVLAPGAYTVDSVMIPPSLASLTIRGDDPANPGTVVIESTPDASQPALASTATALTISGVTLRTIGESPILSVAGTPATITDARIEGDPTAFEGIAYTGPALAFENVALGNGSIVRLLQGMGTTIFNGCTIDDNARVIIYAREGSLSFSRIEGSNVALDIVSSELDHLVFEDSALALGSGGTFLTFGSADTITIR